ncbi:MAG: site-specific integrase, partial [Actinomycetota bacterium]|nr:site-specific integrase [Actinomycetota bacterium]
SVGYIHTTIRKALAQAEAWDLVRKNVARFAKPPKEGHSEPSAMTVEEAQRFLRAIAGDRLEAIYLLAVTTGLRRGELLGLKWVDLDLERGYLRVERSLDTLYGPAVENDPKRASSRRPAVLLPPVVAALEAHKTRQAAERLAAGPAWREHGYVFPTRVGTPERGDNVLKRSLKPLASEIGDPTLDFRKLRRSHSTFYAILNVHPRVAQMSMGHGSFSTTMKYYTGVPADLQKQAAEALGELLFGTPNAPAEEPTLVTLPSDDGELDALEAELKKKLLQVQELKGRVRQD